ncbi:MAG: N-acetyltransferase [Chitinophagaceae bacterium]|nr:MAG: N-acetyltransferase [Chitinophagaceae bacterium]
MFLVGGTKMPDNLLNGVLENLIAAMIGAAFVAIAGFAVARVKNYLFEKKLNVSGTYISKFDDTQSGERVRLYALAKIKQRGRFLIGRSEAFENQPGKERAWILKGEVYSSGTVLGSYVCVTPRQTGMGTFSLETQGDDLVGHWSGYDSENHMMNHGGYAFTRAADLNVRLYQDRDHSTVLRIAATTLGDGYFENPREFAAGVQSILLVGTDRRTKQIVGFAAGRIMAAGEFAKLYPTLSRSLVPIDLREADTAGSVGCLQTVAVSPDFHGRGIGFQLLSELRSRLGKQGATAFISPAWRVDGKTNVGNVLSAMSMKPMTEIPAYWKTECEAGQFTCPAKSGSKPCRCDVVLYKD